MYTKEAEDNDLGTFYSNEKLFIFSRNEAERKNLDLDPLL